MRRTTLQNLKVFQKLCGKNNLGAVVFGTTSGNLTPEAFARREKEGLQEAEGNSFFTISFTRLGAPVS